LARVGDGCGAVRACEADRADASEGAERVGTVAVVFARVGSALESLFFN